MLVRLRPVVHASPTATGLHVRGWASSFTLDGGKGLWTVWQHIAGALADGVEPDDFGAPAGASPAVTRAIEMIIDQLRAHDMVVTVPSTWGTDPPPPDIRSWLESVAPRPQQTWQLLRETTFSVTGSGYPAAAARRALISTGLTVQTEPGEGLLLMAGEHAVAADCSASVGYVVHPGSYQDVLTDAKAIAQRLDVRREKVPEVLGALVGSAAAHRLICALGGLADPSSEFIVHSADELPPRAPELGVLVARLDPLRATYHPWLSTSRPALPSDPLRALDVIADPELGPVPTPETGSLPQLPANITVCGDALGVGPTVDAARLDAAVRAVGVPAGIDRTHALGAALRASTREHLASLPAVAVPEQEWAGDATARRWWKALTLRFGVPATVSVTRLAPRVVHAEIRSGDTVLAWAVEAEAADAVAFAALAATGIEQARQAKVRVTGPGHLSGAAPSQAGADVSWTTRDWYWPADVRGREAALQADLVTLLGIPVPVVEASPRGVYVVRELL
ncbi:MAG: hypothetical protein ABW215_06695 [Kibdelosporangium sp.]